MQKSPPPGWIRRSSEISRHDLAGRPDRVEFRTIARLPERGADELLEQQRIGDLPRVGLETIIGTVARNPTMEISCCCTRVMNRKPWRASAGAEPFVCRQQSLSKLGTALFAPFDCATQKGIFHFDLAVSRIDLDWPETGGSTGQQLTHQDAGDFVLLPTSEDGTRVESPVSDRSNNPANVKWPFDRRRVGKLQFQSFLAFFDTQNIGGNEGNSLLLLCQIVPGLAKPHRIA